MENYLLFRAYSKVITAIIIIFMAGGASLFNGCRMMNASAGSSAEPTLVDLYEMENGNFPDNRHMTIGPHVAFCEFAIGQYYPIMSRELGVGELENGAIGMELDGYPESMISRLRNCRVYVKSPYKPGRFVVRESITGLVIHEGDSLSHDVKELMTKKHNVRDFENILILEEGREPNYGQGLLWFIIGIGLTILAIGISFPLLAWAAKADS